MTWYKLGEKNYNIQVDSKINSLVKLVKISKLLILTQLL